MLSEECLRYKKHIINQSLVTKVARFWKSVSLIYLGFLKNYYLYIKFWMYAIKKLNILISTYGGSL